MAQWASLVSVQPLAQVAVSPADFPFLAQIHAHDMAMVNHRADRNPKGFSWVDETNRSAVVSPYAEAMNRHPYGAWGAAQP
jgi:hypothetical protein